MPVPLRTPYSKAEAKYNVITEFPKLGLHEAAASGNLGLVEYALDHGQPINSVLDGVLPLHAACAGGHIQVVKLLIEHGADVNAPRLPRRYFNDKNRDASAPIVGTSGSTPLHFAAANGNTDVVTLLLLHGAQAVRPDKYGVTPEMLARDNNWMECAQVLQEWVINKDRDLREREEILSKDGAGAASSSGNVSYEHSMEPNPSPSTRRRLHVKHSIDTALNILKASSSSHFDNHSLRPNPTLATVSPPPSPSKPFGDYSFNLDANQNPSPIDPNSRRPSLPQIQQPPPQDYARRKVCAPMPSPTQRRPRSAGTGADRSPEHDAIYLPYGRGGSGRKLASKISLLFKKGQHGETSESVSTPHSTHTPASDSASNLALSSSFKGRPATSSSIDVTHYDQTPTSSRQRSHASSDSPVRGNKITPPPKPIQPPSASFLELDNSAPPSPFRPPLPSAVDLHNALAQHGRDRSKSNATNTSTLSSADISSDDISPSNYGSLILPSVLSSNDALRLRSDSSSSRVLDANANGSSDHLSASGNNEDPKATLRPGILRGHNRTGSSGQPSTPLRALRFDSFSSGDRNRKESSLSGSPASIHARLQPTASSSSLRRNRIDAISSQDSVGDRSPSLSVRPPLERPQLLDEEDEEQDYGQQLPSSRLAPVIDEDGEELHPPSTLLLRERGMSFGSSSQTSLSPLFTNENPHGEAPPALETDFPFSGASPLPNMERKPSSPGNQLSVPEADRRGRGDSLSSTSTTDSANMPQYSTSGSTMGSGTSVTALTPASDGNIPLPSTGQVLDDEDSGDGIQHLEQAQQKERLDIPLAPPITQTPSNYSGLIERRAHSPLDIDIALISSHAQAEALVERTRQDILELASSQEPNSRPSNAGPTPLSAKLAALGESLALERKLREQEKSARMGKSEPEATAPLSPLDQQFDNLTPVQSSNRSGVERQHSLETRTRPAPKMKAKDPRRPSTADGLSNRSVSNSFFPGEHPRHQISLSVSPPSMEQASTSFDRREFFSAAHQRSAVTNTNSMANQKIYEPLAAPALIKTRIAKDLDADSLSRVSSAEGVDTETESSGVPLTRVPTTPASSGRKRDTGRTASSKKLTRMGFTANDQSVGRSSTQPPGKLFGGFKSIMQTLKGKT